MRYAIALIGTALLGACGADGEPIRPTAMTTTIGAGSSGVHAATSVTASNDTMSVTLGL